MKPRATKTDAYLCAGCGRVHEALVRAKSCCAPPPKQVAAWRCWYCGLVFKTKAEVIDHWKRTHPWENNHE